MNGLSGLNAVLIGVALAVLVGGAVAVLFAGLRARRQAEEAFAANARLEAMLAAAPALAMVVRADGRVECPLRLADWLGLASVPRYLDDLCAGDAGLSTDDVAALAADIVGAQKSGRDFARAVRARGSARSLMIWAHAPRGR